MSAIPPSSGAARLASLDQFRGYTVVGMLYFIVGFVAARFVGHLEARSRQGYRRRRRPA